MDARAPAHQKAFKGLESVDAGDFLFMVAGGLGAALLISILLEPSGPEDW